METEKLQSLHFPSDILLHVNDLSLAHSLSHTHVHIHYWSKSLTLQFIHIFFIIEMYAV